MTEAIYFLVFLAIAGSLTGVVVLILLIADMVRRPRG